MLTGHNADNDSDFDPDQDPSSECWRSTSALSALILWVRSPAFRRSGTPPRSGHGRAECRFLPPQEPPEGGTTNSQFQSWRSTSLVDLVVNWMIKSFRHKGLKYFFHTGNRKGINTNHAPKLASILDRLDASATPQDMNLPGYTGCMNL